MDDSPETPTSGEWGWWRALDSQWKALGVIVAAVAIGYVVRGGSDRLFNAPDTVESHGQRIDNLESGAAEMRGQFGDLGEQMSGMKAVTDSTLSLVNKMFCHPMSPFVVECRTTLTPR